MTRRQKHHAGGLATVLAVALIGLVGLAAAVLTVQLGEARLQIPRQADQAQLRAMLLTGAAAAPRLIPGPGKDRAESDQMLLALPRELIARGGQIKLTARDALAGFARIVIIEATLDGRSMRQSLRYLKGDGGWGLAESTLQR
ncbi:hypothetical protein HED60_08915 [Planctomycetales bacterium ZRK34]|nr:hypothetical protein HED60_08915 [Planctomycetales bacterium ZRK34]